MRIIFIQVGELDAALSNFVTTINTSNKIVYTHGGYKLMPFMVPMMVDIAKHMDSVSQYCDIDEVIVSALTSPYRYTQAIGRLCALREEVFRGGSEQKCTQGFKQCVSEARELKIPSLLLDCLECQKVFFEDSGRFEGLDEIKREIAQLTAEYTFSQPEVGQERTARLQEYSENWTSLIRNIKGVASRNIPILLLGETGTGKEVLSRRIHELSGREGEFVAVNLSSIPEELFESEFFGHEKGAFTGAIASKPGFLEMADRGTLFLDEFGDVSPRIQVKLLRVLQDKKFTRVGGTRVLQSDFRLICATNKPLQSMVEAGEFRQDLYYRVNVITFFVPALRHRGNDVFLLARRFLDEIKKSDPSIACTLSKEQLTYLRNYSWPGNVRELKNYIERLAFMPKERAADMHGPSAARVVRTPLSGLPGETDVAPFIRNLAETFKQGKLPTLDTLLAMYVQYVCEVRKGKIYGKGGIAETLDVTPATVYNWIKKYHLK